MVPLSVLDLASVASESTSGDALNATTSLARTADRLGFKRFWVAEHHNMEIVASTSPTILMAHLAASTRRINVGSGGVMLPNHPPLVVAEQIAMLEALHPGRIDLGIGRAPGTDPGTAAALRRSVDRLDVNEFPRHLVDLMGLLGDVREGSRLHERLKATPHATTHPGVYLLGSSGFGAQLAGILGIPFVQAHHFDMGGTDESLRLYRERFQPTDRLTQPYPIVTANVVVADSSEEAYRLSLPGRLVRFWLRTGRRVWLPTVEEAQSHQDLQPALAMPSEALIGSPAEVVAGLVDLANRTGASELMLTSTTAGYAEKVHALELLAGAVEDGSLAQGPAAGPVSGIGGMFFRAVDPSGLATWYQARFGIKPPGPEYEDGSWWQERGPTVFTPFAADTDYFGNDSKQWMVNLRVADLDALVAELRSQGIEVNVHPEAMPNGRFAHLVDPEGNPIELWEPAGPDLYPPTEKTVD